MYNVDPDALEQRVPQFKNKKPSDSSDSKQLSCLYKSTVERLAYKRRKHIKLNRHETHSFERG